MLSLHLELHGVDCLDNNKVMSRVFYLIESLHLHVRNSLRCEYYPYGITFTAHLSESHITVSTWPEKSLVQLDLFLCCEDGLKVAGKAIKLSAEVFHAACYNSAILNREGMTVASLDRKDGDSNVQSRQ